MRVGNGKSIGKVVFGLRCIERISWLCEDGRVVVLWDRRVMMLDLLMLMLVLMLGWMLR